jgi:hypothetical protein
MPTIARPAPRSLAPALVALALAVVALVPASASAQSKTQLRAQAYQIMSRDYHAFHDFKTRQHPRPFNWRDDGCSVPNSVVALSPATFAATRAYARLFDWPCEMHDFGYRNYGGKRLRLDRSEKARGWVDWRLLIETQRACTNSYRGKPIRLKACKGASRAFYSAVHRFGRSAFYG